ncbi:hypothetical protein ElyMa_005813200 [Elysia marginata]|uniref:Uncharacterized protein n=1 Tax=Elysia marginata TaxID=1093978 RepID=A0AAV4FV06_9GAST|nr:hypothetical protein ElyMa_005813200 [Elysia marginata]
MTVPNINIDFDATKRKTKKKKKRGSWGGIRNRLRRRGARLPMPSVTLTNAQSLVNKMDHLQALVKNDGGYRRSNIICVTETWFSEEKLHNPDDIDGYTPIRLDRSKKKTSKEKGGGLLMYVNKDWATNITVRETANTHVMTARFYMCHFAHTIYPVSSHKCLSYLFTYQAQTS